jgi:hypothetical protein
MAHRRKQLNNKKKETTLARGFFHIFVCTCKPDSVPILPAESGAKLSILSETKDCPSNSSGRSFLYSPSANKNGDDHLSCFVVANKIFAVQIRLAAKVRSCT